MPNFNRAKSQLARSTFENQILNVDYWVEKLGETEEALSKIKYFRKFRHVLEFNLIRGRETSWKQENIHDRMREIELEIVSKGSVSNFYELEKFSDNAYQLNFWLFRGWSMEEAIEKQKKVQSDNSIRYANKAKQTPEKYHASRPCRIEYWIKRGFSEQDAKLQVKEVQTTFSLQKCLARHGYPLGLEKFKARQQTWQATINNKPEEELAKMQASKGRTFQQLVEKFGLEKAREICSKRGKQLASIEADNFFCEVINVCYPEDTHETLFTHCISNSERFLWSENNKIYFYDFCDSKNKIIIEYHGILFHPREGDTEFVSLFNKQSYEECYAKDQLKKQLAIDNGFAFLEVYSDDPDKLETAVKFIKENS